MIGLRMAGVDPLPPIVISESDAQTFAVKCACE
jgi:hypothetical protein